MIADFKCLLFVCVQSQDTYFECDNMKGAVTGGQEQIVKFTFKPPSIDPLLQDIGALKGIG